MATLSYQYLRKNSMPLAKEVVSVNLEDEMKQSYLDYAMSVIVGRALPDVRDGLKPVHRRILYAMHELGNYYNRPYKKSARIVGDVIGKYHPHGDNAVYDSIVRMAQTFSMRYVLVDGQGNFGSIDGDAAAAMRYTEVRMAKITHELLADLEKDTVNFALNYDESEQEPMVLPTCLPNLLINGSSGIAVGMATNIPPHNIKEVLQACIALIQQPNLTISDLIHYIPGPDFPTGAIINGASGIRQAYETGRGKIYLRACAQIKEADNGQKPKIIITELPYQVNKARLLERIAELVKEKKLEGITELRDESDKDGIRVVIELRRSDSAEVVLNNLYQQTSLQSVFGINMVALVNGQPKLLNLKQILDAFLQHRREVVTRRTLFDLNKTQHFAHIREGLAVALDNIDAMIAIIRQSKHPSDAKEALQKPYWSATTVLQLLQQQTSSQLSEQGYQLSPIQAQAILDLKLHRLTGLEKDKIFAEYQELLEKINVLEKILSDTKELMQVIQQELEQSLERYQDERLTQIQINQDDLQMEDLIPEEERVVTISHAGYVKAQPVSTYSAQKRGGKGKIATTVKEEDFIDKLFVASSHDMVLCFSSLGRVYLKNVYEFPQGSRTSRGRPFVNLLSLEANEKIHAVLPVKQFNDKQYILMATALGRVKKTALKEFANIRANGLRAINLRENDKLIGVALTDGEQEVMLFNSNGKVVRFHESSVRSLSRTAQGVKGIKLTGDQHVVAMMLADQGMVLTVSENGYGKCTPVENFRSQARGGLGVFAMKISHKNGNIIGALPVNEEDEIMLITDAGTLVRTRVNEIRVTGRVAQGVRLINTRNDEKLIEVEKIVGLGGLDETTETIETTTVDTTTETEVAIAE